eukprot:14001840-Alexandrium_andersonii.AAC.1
MTGALAPGWAPAASRPIPRPHRPAGSDRAGTSLLGASTGGTPAVGPRKPAAGRSRTTCGNPQNSPAGGWSLAILPNPGQ